MMKKFIRYFIRQTILSIIPFLGIYNFYRRKNRDRVLVLVYHDVVGDISECNSSHYNYNTTIDQNRFCEQMEYISRHYTPITLSDFIAWKRNGKQLPPNPVLVTFDDGHTNLYRYAVPILNKFDIKAVFFVKSGCMGTVEQNYCEQYLSYSSTYKDGQKDYGVFRKSPFMKQVKMIEERAGYNRYDIVNELKYAHCTEEECLSLLKMGHSIQSHTVHHYILSSLKDVDVKFELQDSREKLEQLFHKSVNCLAYPFGDPNYDFGSREKKIAEEVGYIFAFSGEREDVNGVSRDDDDFSISRFGDVNHDFLYFKLLLSPVRLLK